MQGGMEAGRVGERKKEREEEANVKLYPFRCIDSLPACVQYLTGVIHVWKTNKSDALKANMQTKSQ